MAGSKKTDILSICNKSYENPAFNWKGGAFFAQETDKYIIQVITKDTKHTTDQGVLLRIRKSETAVFPTPVEPQQ